MPTIMGWHAFVIQVMLETKIIFVFTKSLALKTPTNWETPAFATLDISEKEISVRKSQNPNVEQTATEIA